MRLACVFAMLSLLLLPGWCAAARPNVVMLISDDQTYTDFGFMGHRKIQTPHLDRLAATAARFTHGYVPSSVCRPSLVTLLTGQYPHQHGVHFNHPPPGFSRLTKSQEINGQQYNALRQRADRFIQQAPSLPRILAANGYRCLQTGKYWEGHWRNAGFTEGMTTSQPRKAATATGNKRLAGGDIVAHGNGDHGLAIGRETMQPIFSFVDDCQAKGQPFFIWYAPFLPHLPHNAPQKYREVYKADPDVPAHAGAYYAACTWFDATVGQLVKHLEKRGLAENTIFVFVCDNGFVPDPKKPMAGGDFNYTKRSKRSPFDDGLRTPILLYRKGHTKSATHTTPCSSVDILPTLLEALQINRANHSLSGRSLWPAATGREQLAEKAVFGAIYPGDASSLGNPSRDVAYRWVRKGPFKLIVPHVRKGQQAWGNYLDKPVLFNITEDPGETRNLLGDPKFSRVKLYLMEELDAWWKLDPSEQPAEVTEK